MPTLGVVIRVSGDSAHMGLAPGRNLLSTLVPRALGPASSQWVSAGGFPGVEPPVVPDHGSSSLFSVMGGPVSGQTSEQGTAASLRWRPLSTWVHAGPRSMAVRDNWSTLLMLFTVPIVWLRVTQLREDTGKATVWLCDFVHRGQ